jgi:hypothetical protein
MKINFGHLCENAFLNENNTPSLIGVFSKLITAELPARRNNIGIVFNFQPSDSKKHKISMVIISPSGKEISKSPETDLQTPKELGHNIGFITNTGPLALPEEGNYKLELFIDKEKVDSLPFALKLSKGK